MLIQILTMKAVIVMTIKKRLMMDQRLQFSRCAMCFTKIWDFSTQLKALEESEINISKDATTVSNQTSLVKFTGHKDEVIHYYEFTNKSKIKQLSEIKNLLNLKGYPMLKISYCYILETKYAILIRMLKLET
ncbi:hypothetical protein Tco_0804455 [Tanacetum coccineum]|uniref:Uncharacterized protein n=1 Tax=Tanacetum coccineum TaxID=301880 RepID=A0ABQ5A5D6_9ASTR